MPAICINSYILQTYYFVFCPVIIKCFGLIKTISLTALLPATLWLEIQLSCSLGKPLLTWIIVCPFNFSSSRPCPSHCCSLLMIAPLFQLLTSLGILGLFSPQDATLFLELSDILCFAYRKPLHRVWHSDYVYIVIFICNMTYYSPLLRGPGSTSSPSLPVINFYPLFQPLVCKLSTSLKEGGGGGEVQEGQPSQVAQHCPSLVTVFCLICPSLVKVYWDTFVRH